MSTSTYYRSPLIGLGMTSVVLGVIGLLLAFLPVLGVPISGFGFVFGLFGVIFTLATGQTSLRWPLAGLAICLLALTVNLALGAGPGYELPGHPIPKMWQQSPDTPYVSPPAREW
jgi:hypothetical protein